MCVLIRLSRWTTWRDEDDGAIFGGSGSNLEYEDEDIEDREETNHSGDDHRPEAFDGISAIGSSALKHSATSPPKQEQYRTVLIRCNHHTARARKPRKRSPSNLFKPESRLGSTQPWKHDKLPGSPSTVELPCFLVVPRRFCLQGTELVPTRNNHLIVGKLCSWGSLDWCRTLRKMFLGGWKYWWEHNPS